MTTADSVSFSQDAQIRLVHYTRSWPLTVREFCELWINSVVICKQAEEALNRPDIVVSEAIATINHGVHLEHLKRYGIIALSTPNWTWSIDDGEWPEGRIRMPISKSKVTVVTEEPESLRTCLQCLTDRDERRFRDNVCMTCWYQFRQAKRFKTVKDYIEARRRATPLGVDTAAITGFYVKARQMSAATGIPHHVDHIVPLRAMRNGKHVACGLNVPCNLQVIPATENLKKGNQLPHHTPAPASAAHTRIQPSRESAATAVPPRLRRIDREPLAQQPRTAAPRLVKAKHSTT